MKGFIAFLILVVLSAWLIVVNAAADSVNIKVGGADVISQGVDAMPIVGLAYEHNFKLWDATFGLEGGINCSTTILHDTQTDIGGRFNYYVGEQMGRLNTINYALTLKSYLPYNLYVGAGGGYLANYFAENYRVYMPGEQADVDDEYEAHVVVGYEHNDYFIEYRHMWADLDLESNIQPEGILEAHSSYNNYGVMVGKKIRF